MRATGASHRHHIEILYTTLPLHFRDLLFPANHLLFISCPISILPCAIVLHFGRNNFLGNQAWLLPAYLERMGSLHSGIFDLLDILDIPYSLFNSLTYRVPISFPQLTMILNIPLLLSRLRNGSETVVEKPVVELDGDEMTIWKKTREEAYRHIGCFRVSSQTPNFHLILPDLKLDIIWGSSPEFRFVRDNIQNFYFALPKAAHNLQPDGPRCSS